MKILVTGGAGFIGVNLARRSRGTHQLIAFDDFSLGRRVDAEAAGYDQIVVGDIRVPGAVARHLIGVDVVVHLAAQTGVPSSIKDPRADASLNIFGTLEVLEACREAGVGRVVLASSAAPLGRALPPANESVLPHPVSPYGASKLALEAYASAYSSSFGLSTCALRFSNVYGPFSYLKGSVVAHWMRELLAGRAITINGSGTQTRDFVHVHDICDAILLAAERDAPSGLYQLGTGVETSIRSLAEMLTDLFGLDPQQVIGHASPLPGEVERSVCDISKARTELGFAPQWSVRDGLVGTLEWFRSADPATIN